MATSPVGAPHPVIALPRDRYPGRRNSRGLDLASEAVLADLSKALTHSTGTEWRAAPLIAGLAKPRPAAPVLNPADHRDVVGEVAFALPEDALLAARAAQAAFADRKSTRLNSSH